MRPPARTALALGAAAAAATAAAAPASAVPRETVAPAVAYAPQPAASGTLWLGPQSVSASVAVSGPRGGVPHPCVTNNGPHDIAVTDTTIRDSRHAVSGPGLTLLHPGRTSCWAHGRVSLPARWHVAAVDQLNGRGGHLTLTVRPTGTAPRHHRARHLSPVTPAAIVARVQAAAGRLAVDGDYGPLTDARLRHITAHWRSMRGTVARVQRALGVTPDGIVGPRTRDALMQLHNAAYGRYRSR